jgi:serine/threonine-protein kinase
VKPPDDAAVARLQRLLATPDLGDPRYQLGERIGAGGMGVVHVGLDQRLGREVAIKLLHPGSLAAADVARLRREALLLARLEHPGIVPVHDLGELPDGGVFLVR